MPAQHELDKVYLSMAFTWSQLSKAKRAKVGCLIVKDRQIISDGYNGTPKNFPNECEHTEESVGRGHPSLGKTKPEVIHAESNAITKLAKSTMSSTGATLYTTHMPCFDCAKLIIQAQIDRVVCGQYFTSEPGTELLKRACVRMTLVTEQ